jgi:hypothetical protein
LLLNMMSVNDRAARMPEISPTKGDTSAPSAAINTQVPASIAA